MPNQIRSLLVLLSFTLLLTPFSDSNATTSTLGSKKAVDLESSSVRAFLSQIYQQSATKKSTESAYAEVRRIEELNSVGYRSVIGVSPYHNERSYQAQSSGTAQGEQSGAQLSLQQQTPWGLSLRADADLVQNMNLPNTAKLNSSLTWSLALELWQNDFGRVDRIQQGEFTLSQARQKLSYEQDLKKACLVSGDLVMRYILGLEGLQQSRELQEQAQQLSLLVQRGQRQGLISKLDALSLESEIVQAQQEYLRARTELELIEQDLIKESSIKAPRLNLADGAQSLDRMAEALSEKLLQLQLDLTSAKSYELSLKEIELQLIQFGVEKQEEALQPALNLAVKDARLDGEIAANDEYQQNDQSVALSLTLKLNDTIEQARALELRGQKIKAQSEFVQTQSVQIDQLRQIQSQLKGQKSNLGLAKRLKLLKQQIFEESVRRFRQGRLEFQELLRQRQAANAARQKYFAELKSIWNSALSGHANLSAVENFCERIQ